MDHMKNEHCSKRQFLLFGIDTAIVLFLLAAEFSRTSRSLTVDGITMAAAIFAVALFPYAFPAVVSRPPFVKWAMVRLAVLITGLAAGAGLGLTDAGNAGSIPMTLLIFAAIGSLATQSYALIRLDPAN
jgi:hypothetical protein